jgi:hypothetical protein
VRNCAPVPGGVTTSWTVWDVGVGVWTRVDCSLYRVRQQHGAGNRMLFPYSTLVFQSALSEFQAIARLQAAVEPERWFRLRSAERPFEGTVEGRTFRIQRIIQYRNSFLPALHGKVEPTADGRARVVVAFRLAPAVMVFMTLWFGLLLLFGMVALVQPAAEGQTGGLPVIGGMLVFGVVLVLGGFGFEASKARQLLEELFSARQSPIGSAAA